MKTIPRSLVAFALFVLLSAGSLGVVGMVQAGDHILPGRPVELAYLDLPEPRIGDRWTYRALNAQTGELEGPEMHREWLEPALTVDADGVGWMALRLTTARLPVEYSDLVTWVFRPSDGVLIAVNHYGEQADDDSDEAVNQLNTSVTWEGSDHYASGTTMCELAPHLRARPISVDAGFALPPCWIGTAGSGMWTRMAAVGAYSFQDHTYVVFDNAAKQGIQRVVYRTDLPVPTLIVSDCGWNPCGIVALTGFSPGGVPLLTNNEPIYELPKLDFAPLHPWGLNDAGVDHPYPLSEAWKDAWENEEGHLRDFVAENPGPGIHSMRYEHAETDRETSDAWQWSLSGSGDDGSFCQSRVVRKEPYSVLDPLREPLATQEDPPDCGSNRSSGRPLRDVDEGPTVASLQAAWRLYASTHGFPEGPIYWSVEDLGKSTDPRPRFTIGVKWYEEISSGPAVVGEKTTSFYEARIVFDEKGQIVRTGRFMHSLGFEVVNPDADTAEPKDLQPEAAGPVQDVPVWAFPAMADAAYVTAVAILVTILYWAFPWIKQLAGAALFSRVTRDEALDNDARASVLAAIEAEPGIHDRELQRRTGLARGQLSHHLSKLVDTGLVRRHRTATMTTYWPPGAPVTQNEKEILRAPLARDVHALLQKEPSLSVAEAARRLGQRRQTVAYHVKRLRAAGLLPS